MLRSLVMLLALLLSPPALASEAVKAGDLSITGSWTRAVPPGAKVAGGYLTVTNDGAETDRLLGGSAQFASRVEIHEMAMEDGVMRMAPVDGGLEIAPGATVELKPGGYHVMFMGLTAEPKRGETVPVTLVFERAGEVTVPMPVAAIGAREPDQSETNHGSMEHGSPGSDATN